MATTGQIFSVSETVRPGHVLQLALDYSYGDEDSDEIEFTLSGDVTPEGPHLEIKAHSNLSKGEMRTLMLGLDPTSLCLMGCAGSGLVKPLIDCFDPSPRKYIACLKGKGLKIASGIVTCAIACFTGS